MAWKFTISSLEPFNEQWIYIDATDGEVVGDTPLLLDANTSGNAETLYSGTVGITCDSHSGSYRLYETRTSTPNHSVNIHTWNCLSQPNLPNAIEFTNSNTNWTTGSWPAISQDQAALDAHWAEEKALDYWSTVHSRNSLDNQGLPITGYVHFYDPNDTITWPNNASWDGNSHVMLYGDGDGGVHFYPLVALDVVAHEMGHGIAQYTANFHSLYHNQECDALNEGFSDIWGACVEDWATSNKQTWLMGEEIVNPLFTCLRNLQNPNDISALEGQHPDTYHGDFWDFNGEPHNNSTVLSHWFYLLSEGGNGTNDLGNAYSVNSIGINDAQHTAFRGESMYLNSSATYADARNATIQATTDLFGSNSCQVINVTNAWYAVGVGSQFQYSNVTISGPTLVCTSNTTFTLHNTPPGDTVNWTKSSNLQYVSGQGTDNYTVKAYSSASGNGWVQATIYLSGCGSVTLPRYSVWAGTPQITNKKVDGGYYYPGMQICPGNHYLNVTPVGGDAGTATWTVPWGITYFVGINELDFTFPFSASGVSITARSTNSCGTGSNGSFYLTRKTWGCSGYYAMTVNPNPASDHVTITMIDNAPLVEYSDSSINNTTITDAKAVGPTIYTIRIYNSQSVLISTVTRTGKSFDIPLINMRDGTYIIEVSDGKNSYRRQLIVKHN